MTDEEPTRHRPPAGDEPTIVPPRTPQGWPQSGEPAGTPPSAPPSGPPSSQQPTLPPPYAGPATPSTPPPAAPWAGGAGWSGAGSTPPGVPSMGYPFTMPRGGAPVGPPMTPYGGGQPGPRRRGTGLVVGLVLALVLVLGGIGGTAWWLVRDGHDDTTAADPAPAGASAGPSTSPSPSANPSAVPSASPSPGASTSPGISPPSPSPTPSPSTPKTPTFPSTGPVSYREWSHDWNFRLGSTHLSASFVQGHDFPTCAGVEKNGGLTALGCQRASTLVYHARGGGVGMTHLILTMRSAKDAMLGAKGEVTQDDWIARPASWVVPQGTWVAHPTGRYLVITLVTHKASVSDDVASDYLHFGNADISGALSFR